MKKYQIAFIILIVVTTGALIGLMEAEIAYQVPKPKQTTHYYQVDTYPYYGADTLHSEILPTRSVYAGPDLRGEDGE